MAGLKPIAYKIALGHILFWIAFIYYDTIIANWQNSDELLFQFVFHINGPSIIMSIILTYFNLFVLLPTLYQRQRYAWYTACLCLSLIAGALLTRFITHEFIVPWEKVHDPGRYSHEVKHFWIPARILRVAIQYYPVVAIVTVFELMRRGWQNEKRLREAESERSTAEMNFLKAQINPHFFFNTLNSLYALILQGSDKAAKLVMRLSALMRYMIYNVNAEQVNLNDEIVELENYLAIEQLRFGDRFELSFHFSGDIAGKRIMPLALLPFAENAFKHGIEEGTGWVTIMLEVKGNQMLYHVENGIQNRAIKQQAGIGLANLRRRLDLIYPDKHKISIHQSEDTFEATLKIEL